MQEALSVIKRCPLLRGLCKNISVTHKKYYDDDKMKFMRHADNDVQCCDQLLKKYVSEYQ